MPKLTKRAMRYGRTYPIYKKASHLKKVNASNGFLHS